MAVDVGQVMLHVAPDMEGFGQEVDQGVQSQESRFRRSGRRIGQALGAGAAAAGAALEGFARQQAPLRESSQRLGASIGENAERMRDMALDTSNVTFPLDEVYDIMESGRQQGLESADQLQSFAQFWDMVGDATGESGTELANSSVALRAVGVEAGNDAEALSALGFVTQETTGSTRDFLSFLERTGPELREMDADVNDAAAILGVLESELGMSGRTARQEFRSAINESDGDMNTMLETLGVSTEQFEDYRAKVDESSDVIERNADIHADSYTTLERVQHWAQEVAHEYAGLFDVAQMLAVPLIALGAALAGIVTVGPAVVAAVGAISAPILAAVAAGAALAAGLVMLYRRSETFQNIVQGVFDWFREAVPAAIEFVRDVIDGFVSVATAAWERWGDDIVEIAQAAWDIIEAIVTRVIDDVRRTIATVTAVIEAIWERWGDDIAAYAQRTWDNIKQVIDGVLTIIRGIFETFAGLFTGDWERMWEGVKSIGTGVWNAIEGLVDQLLNTLSTIVTVGLEAIQETWNSIWSAVKNFVSDRIDDVVGFFTAFPGRAQSALSNAWPTFWDWYMGIAQAIYDFLSGKGEDLVDWFGELPGRLADAMSSLGSELRDMGREQWSNFTDWLGERGRALVDWFRDLPGRISDALGNLGQTIKDKFTFDLPGISFSGDGPGGYTGPGGGGPAAARAAQAAVGLPIVQTSGYRTPAQNRAAGGSPTSWHLDRSNPATDWAGPTWALDEFARRLRSMGGWRELLWRVPNHAPGDNPHVHVADDGATLMPGLNLLDNQIGQAEPLARVDTLRPQLERLGSELSPKLDTLIDKLDRPNVHLVASDDVASDVQRAKLALMR